MKPIKLRLLAVLSVFLAASFSADACTSMLVSAKASGTGRPLMWKNRDTDHDQNFIEKVPAMGGRMGYVALFNGGDAKLSEAWMGMNDAGFAVMNTASYNLAPDTAKIKDREGLLMTAALKNCRSVDDFERLIKAQKRPLGVQANFGVMDAMGGLAYFEVNDIGYKRYNVDDAPGGYMVRSNYSVAGKKGEGHGYLREASLKHVLAEELASGSFRPESFTEKASKSFYNAVIGKDFETDTCSWVIDQDFIARYTSSASVVIEGVNPDQPVSDMIMWTLLGYPPCSFVVPVTLNNVPDMLRPTADGFTSPYCTSVLGIKENVFPIKIDNGKRYINMKALRPILQKSRQKSLEIYNKAYELRK